MKREKYIGLDVHQATTTAAVRDADGKLVMESILETKSEVLLQFIKGLRGDLHVTLEEGTWAAWLYDLLRPHVARVVICNPRKNALLQEGNKNDRVDARKWADLLRGNHLSPVYHGEHGVSVLRERSRSYLTLVKDVTRVMMRLKAIYRGRGTTAMLASFRISSRSSPSRTMCEQRNGSNHRNGRCVIIEMGLDVAALSCFAGEGRKMSVDIPFIEQRFP